MKQLAGTPQLLTFRFVFQMFQNHWKPQLPEPLFASADPPNRSGEGKERSRGGGMREGADMGMLCSIGFIWTLLHDWMDNVGLTVGAFDSLALNLIVIGISLYIIIVNHRCTRGLRSSFHL